MHMAVACASRQLFTLLFCCRGASRMVPTGKCCPADITCTAHVQVPRPWVPQATTSSAGPQPVSGAPRQHSENGRGPEKFSGPGAQQPIAAPVTVEAARQAVQTRLNGILDGGSLARTDSVSQGRDQPRRPLPLSVLSEALAYPSLVSPAAQPSQAQSRAGDLLVRPSEEHQRDSTRVPAQTDRHDAAARTVVHSAFQTASPHAVQLPQVAAQGQCGASLSVSWPAPAVACRAVQAEDTRRDARVDSHAAQLAAAAGAEAVCRPPQVESRVDEASWGAAIPYLTASSDQPANASGTDTEDEAPAPPPKRRRPTARAADAAQPPVMSSECAVLPSVRLTVSDNASVMYSGCCMLASANSGRCQVGVVLQEIRVWCCPAVVLYVSRQVACRGLWLIRHCYHACESPKLIDTPIDG